MWPKRSIAFNIRRNGSLITQVNLQTTVDTGITMTGFPGVINPFHEISACAASGYRYYHDWQELTAQEKSILVGWYLADKLLENHKEDARNRAMEKSQKKPKGKGKS